MIDQTGSINISAIQQAGNASSIIEKVKNRMKARRRLSKELKISRTSIQRILKDDLGYFPYKIIIKLFLIDAHKAEKNGSQIGFDQISLKSKLCQFSFRMRNFLTLMASTTFKMIVSGLLVVSRQIKMVESCREGSFHKK